jgi:hypothetical protein
MRRWIYGHSRVRLNSGPKEKQLRLPGAVSLQLCTALAVSAAVESATAMEAPAMEAAAMPATAIEATKPDYRPTNIGGAIAAIVGGVIGVADRARRIGIGRAYSDEDTSRGGSGNRSRGASQHKCSEGKFREPFHDLVSFHLTVARRVRLDC